MRKKNVTNAFAISLALTTGIGITVLPQSLPEASAAEESVDNIYPSDTETEDSWKWGGKLTCDDIMDEEFKSKLKEIGDVETYIPDKSDPGAGYFKHPTEEELNNLEESNWNAPGDYSYLVENLPENKRPKLMKVKGKDKYFIASSSDESERNPKIDKKNFYRLFEPENYLPKEMVEWKEDTKTGRKYNAKIYNGWGFSSGIMGVGDVEEYSPYGGEDNFITRVTLKPEFMPDKGLSLSERLDYFMENDDVFSVSTSYYKNRYTSKMEDGRFVYNSRDYYKDSESGETTISHSNEAFATCGPLVSVKPSSVSDIDSTYTAGAKDLSMRANDYLPPSDNGLTLRKTNDSDKLLAGSSWKIKNLGTKEEFIVTDNKKPDNNDKNTLEDLYKEDGLINVDLPEGRYELVETEAPEGYKVDSTPRKFIIHDRTGASFGMGAIVNKPESSDTPSESEKPGESTTPSTSDKPSDSITSSTSKKPSTKTSDKSTTISNDKEDTTTSASSETPTTPNQTKTPGKVNTPNNPNTPNQDFTPVKNTNPGTFNGGVSSNVEGEEVSDGGKVDTGSPTISILNKIRTIF